MRLCKITRKKANKQKLKVRKEGRQAGRRKEGEKEGRWEEGRRKDGRTEGTKERENEERKGDGSRGATSELVLWPAYTCTHMYTHVHPSHSYMHTDRHTKLVTDKQGRPRCGWGGIADGRVTWNLNHSAGSCV